MPNAHSNVPAPEEPKTKPARDALGRLLPGHTANRSGVSREQQAFLARLTTSDGEEIYRSFMNLVRKGNTIATVRAMEYLAGKPKEILEVQQPTEPETVDLGRLSKEQLEDLEKLILAAKASQ